MILVIDNYDSFTYNLVQYLGELGEEVEVVRNDQITVEEIEKKSPKMIVLSPGPGDPDKAGICLDVVKKLGSQFPILGVCLGHQTIAQAFGGEVIQAEQLMHGKTSEVFHDQKTIFRDLASPLTATRYHSLLVNHKNVPDVLEVSAKSSSGEIMGLRHRSLPIEGVQFHPESILSEGGKQMLRNFLSHYC